MRGFFIGAFVFACAIAAPSARAEAPAAASPAWTSQSRFTVYSETYYLSRRDDFLTQSRVRLELLRFKDTVGFYLGAAIDQDLRSRSTLVFNDNYVAPLVGAQARVGKLPLWAFVEYRQAFRVVERPDGRALTESDFRPGLYAYHWQDVAKLVDRARLFSETYAELVHSDRVRSNVYFAAWSRVGTRLTLNDRLWLDPYAELFAKKDGLNIAFQNGAEARLGARVTRTFGEKWAASLFVHRAAGYDPTPHQNYQEWRGLLAVSLWE